jgi:D-cysteine desulfhydrase
VADLRQVLAALPSMGWLTAPSPVESIPQLALRLGVEWLGVKRDDRLPALFGGSKPRKLERMLALPPWVGADRWSSSGAIGSGHLVALAAAAERLGKSLEAHLFPTPITPHTLESLGFIATRAQLAFHHRRLTMVLAAPSLYAGGRHRGAAVIPPGATTAEAMIGSVAAGFELADQIARGELPEPERVYVAFGTGGTAIGIAAGLLMAGVRAQVHAVATVERVLSPTARVRSLGRALERLLSRAGIALPGPLPLVIDRRHLGLGYGIPTIASLAATLELDRAGVPLEPVYTGKAWAALVRDAAAEPVRRVLFWNTRRGGPLPIEPGWRTRLPADLLRWLEREEEEAGGPRPRAGRRRFLQGSGAVLAAGALGVGLASTGYPAFDGRWLTAREAAVLRAAAEAILPPAPLSEPQKERLPGNVDRFLAATPEATRRELHLMFLLIEHGGLRSRFTRLSPEGRRAVLTGLARRGGALAQVARGLRDLVLVGYYQEPSSWAALGYGGPWPIEGGLPSSYDALKAPAGATPRASQRRP